MYNNKWTPYFLATAIFGAGMVFGDLLLVVIPNPTDPPPIVASTDSTEIDWQTSAFEAWALIALLPDELAIDRQNCETVRSIRQCAWMMERMEFGIRIIIHQKMPAELQNTFVPK